MDEYIKAHKFSSNNKEQILTSKKCGCFYCLKIFKPIELTSWLNEKTGTAICPYCGMDSVIGDKSGFKIESDFLNEMHEYWFNKKSK